MLVGANLLHPVLITLHLVIAAPRSSTSSAASGISSLRKWQLRQCSKGLEESTNR